jgi:dTDP-4-amino-4,6-dideoxygalactose transaminase
MTSAAAPRARPSTAPMRVPFFDRARGDAALEPALTEAFQRVVRSGHYILGPEVEALEAACAELLGGFYTIGMSSCTDALLASMMALGVGPGDEVICPAYTFFATAGSIARLGARPVFADVLPGCFTLDANDAARRITPRTKGIIAVHLFGLCAPALPLSDLARASGLWLLEDCAQAMGAERDGRRAGEVGALGCFSFFPTKNLGGFGEGGLVATSDADLARLVRAIRVHGSGPKNYHEIVGGNFRIDALQAALLCVKLRGFDAALARRRANAALYDSLLVQSGLTEPGGPIVLGDRPPGHTFNQYILRVRGGRDVRARDELRASLAAAGVGTEIYYPLPLPLQRAFASLGHREGDFPIAEAAARETLALPIFPELSEDEIRYVARRIEEHLGAAH